MKKTADNKVKPADISVFNERKSMPDARDLDNSLGKSHELWNELIEYVHSVYNGAKDEWNYPGEKYGWSFRIKDTRRVIIYLLPRSNFFKAALVFGEKAYEEIMKSTVGKEIKEELSEARVYGEGRGIRIDVRNKSILNEIKSLIDIKLEN
ncbi:MAG: DUF3788 domain-containing protein [Ignavibacteria bacterium]